MNVWIGMGRLCNDPDVRYTQGDNAMAIARYRLAVDRPKRKDQKESGADFISCVAFGKGAEFAEKYLSKGTKIVVRGHIQTGSYTNKDGQKVYTTDVAVDAQEFAESKKDGSGAAPKASSADAAIQGFMDVPDNIDEELPFAD